MRMVVSKTSIEKQHDKTNYTNYIKDRLAVSYHSISWKFKRGRPQPSQNCAYFFLNTSCIYKVHLMNHITKMDQCFFHKRAFCFKNIRTTVVAKRRKESMIDAKNSSAPQPHPKKRKLTQNM